MTISPWPASRPQKKILVDPGRPASGWFAARPSKTEAVYNIYAESFKSEAYLDTIVREALAMVDEALTADELVQRHAG